MKKNVKKVENKGIDSTELIMALDDLEKEQGIKKEFVIESIETALVTLLNCLSKKYAITLCLEKKEGIFLDEINKYPPETVFYISAMNKETSDYIKNNCKYKILELPDKNYKSMYDAVADLYIMSRAKEGIYSFGSTFGELAWWLAEEEQKYSIAGSDKNWKWIKNN